MDSVFFRHAACAAALLATAACSTPDGQASRSMSGADATASAARSSVPFRSAFEGYQSDKEVEAENWKRANDTVHTIGGWRSYARESAPMPAGAPR